MSLFVLTTGWSHLAIQSTELVAREAGSRSHELVFGSIDGILAVLGIISAAGSALLRPEQIFTTALGGSSCRVSIGVRSHLSFGDDREEGASIRRAGKYEKKKEREDLACSGNRPPPRPSNARSD